VIQDSRPLWNMEKNLTSSPADWSVMQKCSGKGWLVGPSHHLLCISKLGKPFTSWLLRPCDEIQGTLGQNASCRGILWKVSAEIEISTWFPSWEKDSHTHKHEKFLSLARERWTITESNFLRKQIWYDESKFPYLKPLFGTQHILKILKDQC